MKFLTAILVTALLAFAAGLFTFLPWWSFAITSFVVGVALKQSSLNSFVAGFLGVAILWAVLAFLKDSANEHLLSSKVAQILPLGGSWVVLLLVTAIVGGLVSGLSALTASFVRGKA